MDALLPAINPAPILPPRTSRFDHALLSFGSHTNLKSNRIWTRSRIEVKAQAEQQWSIDFSDPDWKSKYQSDFEERFRIPHITDALPGAVSYPSTFCLRMRFLLRP
ncbi:hypothetical protein ACS0TY_027495 [Phlomoides rotata]